MPPRANQPYIISQTLINGQFDDITTVIVQEKDLLPKHLEVFDHARPLGLSPGFAASTGALNALAIADDKNCVVVEFASGKGSISVNPESTWGKARQLLLDSVLCRNAGELFGFSFDRIASALYQNHRLRVINAVDIPSSVDEKERTPPLTVIIAILGKDAPLIKPNITTSFQELNYDEEERSRMLAPAQRAWISQHLATQDNGSQVMGKVKRINTKDMAEELLRQITSLGNESHRLDHLKPMETTHKIHTSKSTTGPVEAKPRAYKDKFRESQPVRVSVIGARGEMRVKGMVTAAHGKTALINTQHTAVGEVVNITSIGRDAPTLADRGETNALLGALQGNSQIVGNPWFKNIFSATSDDFELEWPEEWSQELEGDAKRSSPELPPKPHPTSSQKSPQNSLKKISQPQPNPSPPKPDFSHLNLSQQKAVEDISAKDDTKRIVLIQGPPGTGKTSVIASYVTSAVEQGERGIWLIAQSNVAVKNIAEKLIKIGFERWRLLVSEDFHFEWNQQIYARAMQKNMIISNQFKFVKPRDLKDCAVMLCTLSMLSNPVIGRFISAVPLITLLVDEASQIRIGGYLPVFQRFSSLRKMCFIGDNKQLPPHQQENIKDMRSIFEVTHLSKYICFLDIQYRMPPQIGKFISKEVYDEMLNSNPKHEVKNTTLACYFVDIPGKEQREGSSWKNLEECAAVIKIGQYFQEQNPEKEYKLITPYEGQRNIVEETMIKTEGYKWEGKCFNVDSFQGNEEDYIIVSLVRSRELGFLKNLRRTNVMLTRFKRGMIILSSKKFLLGAGAKSLAGKLATYVSEEAWLKAEDLEQGVIEHKLKF